MLLGETNSLLEAVELVGVSTVQERVYALAVVAPIDLDLNFPARESTEEPWGTRARVTMCSCARQFEL